MSAADVLRSVRRWNIGVVGGAGAIAAAAVWWSSGPADGLAVLLAVLLALGATVLSTVVDAGRIGGYAGLVSVTKFVVLLGILVVLRQVVALDWSTFLLAFVAAVVGCLVVTSTVVLTSRGPELECEEADTEGGNSLGTR